MTSPAFAHAHSDLTAYALVFASSSAIQVIAAAGCLWLAITALLRFLPRNPAQGAPKRDWRGLGVLKLHKLVIPLACLTLTGWVWIATQGA